MSPAATDPACKVCGGPAPFFDACDLNSHCMRPESPDLLPASGISVAYHRCRNCGFLFTGFMDGFTADDFRTRIYNEEYARVDPGFEAARPRDNAAKLLGLFGDVPIRICDYGGGRGGTALAINAAGRRLRAETWDPFFGSGQAPPGPFDMVVSIEVFEHSPTPAATLGQMLALTDANRLVLMGTLCQPDDIALQKTGWWYCSPRNGHISLHTRDSLSRLADDAGVAVLHFNDSSHLFYDRLPAWIEGFVG